MGGSIVSKAKLPTAISHALADCRGHFIVAAGFSALINVLYLAPTIYMMQVYDRVVPTGGVATLLWITAFLAIALLTLTMLEAVRSRVLMRASLRLNRHLAGEILERLMGRAKGKVGDASTRQAMREFDTVRQVLGGPTASAVLDAPWTPLYLLVAFMIHPLLGWLIVAAGVLLVGLAIANERHTRAKSVEVHASASTAYLSHQSTIAESEVIRALGMQGAMVERQTQQRQVSLDTSSQLQILGVRYNSVVKFFRMFLQSAALGLGAWLAVQGQISVGAIIAASVLLSRALQPVEQLVGNWSAIEQARLGAQTILKLFANSESRKTERTELPAPNGRLELERVIYKAPRGGDFLLRNVSLTLNPGEILGVIGPSGSGKSMLARVCAGAIAPDSGDVRIDGASMNDWDPERLAPHIGYLPQTLSLLPGTIGENISRFAGGAGRDKAKLDHLIVEAGKRAGVHDMILQLPNGYDTAIRDNGFELSAGQAQRIALARALFQDPEVIILDEPNSSLDTDGEEALGRAVAAAVARGAAVMVVAHRTAILANANRLAVMQNGGIVQMGPREEVIAELKKHATRQNVVPISQARP
ncbi:MAG: type I secretion system permease/ATPase [Alphaproteobacteria bacterium]|nr:MAG: type I secretion system permease/ATPase [Alphaproteobacteria bacterium]